MNHPVAAPPTVYQPTVIPSAVPDQLPAGPLVVQTVILPGGQAVNAYVPAAQPAGPEPVRVDLGGPLIPRWAATTGWLSVTLSVSGLVLAEAIHVATQVLHELVTTLIELCVVLFALAVLIGFLALVSRFVRRRRGGATATATATASKRGMFGRVTATATATVKR